MVDCTTWNAPAHLCEIQVHIQVRTFHAIIVFCIRLVCSHATPTYCTHAYQSMSWVIPIPFAQYVIVDGHQYLIYVEGIVTIYRLLEHFIVY